MESWKGLLPLTVSWRIVCATSGSTSVPIPQMVVVASPLCSVRIKVRAARRALLFASLPLARRAASLSVRPAKAKAKA